MTNDTPFDLSLDSTFDDFDPFEDLESSEDEDEKEPYVISRAGAEDTSADGEESQTQPARTQPEIEEKSAYELTNDLLVSMAPRRKVLLSTLAFCLEPQPINAVNDYIDTLQKDNYSVYTPADLCNLLEGAGAIERVNTEGQPTQDTTAEPKSVVVDGVEYLEANDEVEFFWKTTDAGRQVLDEDRPLERMQELIERDKKYADIYSRILNICSAEKGSPIADINAAVDDDPLVQKPRLYAPHFIDLLEKCEAVTWKDKAWHITEIGKTALDLLAAMPPADEITDEKSETDVASATDKSNGKEG